MVKIILQTKEKKIYKNTRQKKSTIRIPKVGNENGKDIFFCYTYIVWLILIIWFYG